MSISKKLIFLFLMISLTPITVISFFSYTTTRESLSKQVLNQLSFVAQIQKNRINTIINQNLERLNSVSNRKQISTLLLNQEAKEESVAQIQDLLHEARSSNRSFKDIYLLNPQGSVVAATKDTIIGANFASSEFFVKGKQGATIANFFYDEDRNLRVYLSGPIESENNLLGVIVVIESDVDNILSLIKDYSGLGETGELLLAKRDENGNAIFITPSRFNANAALNRVVLKTTTGDPIIQALLGKEHVLTNALDYRGKRVLAATKFIDSTGWGLVVKMDREEAFAPIYQLGNYFFYTAAITSLLAILNAWFFAQTITRPILKLAHFTDVVRKGDLNQQAAVESHDEIGKLAKSFNEMVQKVKQSQELLEEKVSEKTSELATIVRNMQQQIAKDEALIASIGDGVIATDEGERIILINTAACEMLKLEEHRVLGRKIQEVIKIGDNVHENVSEEKNPITQALEKKRKITTTPTDGLTFSRSDATVFPVSITVTPVTLGANIMGTILVFRDATVPREIDRMKNEFISLASHQLRTPLSAIKWFSGMLLEGDSGPLTEEQKEVAENIAAANQRMIDLVNSLLNISRIESGRIVIDARPTNLSSLVKSVLVEVQEKIVSKNLHVSLSIHPELPLIFTDPKLIREVFINLLTNAIKYTAAGGYIMIVISKKTKEIITQITDTGYGIPTKEQTKMFEKFYRGENIISKETEGSGLGLYLVKEIVESCGGTIWFTSKEGEGTTFWFTLPLTPPEAITNVKNTFQRNPEQLRKKAA